MSANTPKQTKRKAPHSAWKKGQSGNPSGRPKVVEHVRDLAREHTEIAIRTLAEICVAGDRGAARVAAAEALLNRGWGRPMQPVEHEIKSLSDEELLRRARRALLGGE